MAQVCTGWMIFLPPSQLLQSNERNQRHNQSRQLPLGVSQEGAPGILLQPKVKLKKKDENELVQAAIVKRSGVKVQD